MQRISDAVIHGRTLPLGCTSEASESLYQEFFSVITKLVLSLVEEMKKYRAQAMRLFMAGPPPQGCTSKASESQFSIPSGQATTKVYTHVAETSFKDIADLLS